MAEGTQSAIRTSDDQSQCLTKLEELAAFLQLLMHDMSRRFTLLEAKLEPSGKTAESGEEDEVSQLLPTLDDGGSKKLKIGGGNRLIKIDMSRFNGENPLGWLFKIDWFFSYYEMTETQRFTIAYVYMDGPALNWYQWKHHNGQLITWTSFKEGLMNRFDPSPYRDLQGELANYNNESQFRSFTISLKTSPIGYPAFLYLSCKAASNPAFAGTSDVKCGRCSLRHWSTHSS